MECLVLAGLSRIFAESDADPFTVLCSGVEQQFLLGIQQQRQESARTVVDAAPADVEGPLPFLAAVDDQAAATADTGIVDLAQTLLAGIGLTAADASRNQRSAPLNTFVRVLRSRMRSLVADYQSRGG